MSFQLMYTN